MDLLAGGEVPVVDVVAVGGHGMLAVRGEGGAVEEAFVAGQGEEFFSTGEVPGPGDAVGAGGEDALAVGGEAQRLDVGRVVEEALALAEGLGAGGGAEGEQEGEAAEANS